jgi:hypothetical protein
MIKQWEVRAPRKATEQQKELLRHTYSAGIHLAMIHSELGA